MKNILIVLGFLLTFVAGYFVSQKYDFKIEKKDQENIITTTVEPTKSNDHLVGNDKDEHGCIGSAGYTWCEIKNKCLRTWEEKCEEESNEEEIKAAILTKHGWSESEVNIAVSKEDGTFARGSIKEVAAISGGMFLAKKVSGQWEIVFEGNGVPDCNLLKVTYQFPTDFLVGVCD